MTGPVFISYSRDDRAYVEKLARYLDTVGVPTWWDYRIAPGVRFPTEIQDRIDSCAAFVVVLTPTAVASDWVQDELHYALHQNKAVLPLVLERCRLPLRIISLNHEDVIGGRMPSDRFASRLISCLVGTEHG